MSLINDALKRATQAQPPSAPAPEPETPMQPVEPSQPPGLPVYFIPILLLIISGACWFLVKGWETRRQSGLYPEPVVVTAREVPTTVPAGGSSQPIPADRQFALDAAPTPSAPVAASAPGTNSTAVTETPAPAGAVANDGTPKPAPFKLQGIFYRPTNPSAVVNSKTVCVGDLIANGKVKAIDRQSVTIEVGGEIKVLTFQ